MRAELREKALTGEYTRQETDMDRFWSEGLHYSMERCVMGTYSATDLVRKHKHIDVSAWDVTDMEIARQYLNVLWDTREEGKRKRIPFTRETFPYLDINPPGWFVKPTRGYLAYVDIKSCYFQLYSPLTWDLRFRAGERPTFMLGTIPFVALDWLRSEKMVRNGIIGIMRSRRRGEYQKGKYVEQEVFNKYLSPELWGYLMFTLHSIAHEALMKFDILYWNTDGCILPGDQAANFIEWIANEWALVATIRALGEGAVYGYCAYDIEGVKTATVNTSRPINYLHAYTPAMSAQLKKYRKWAKNRADYAF